MKIQFSNRNDAIRNLRVMGALLGVLALILCTASGARAQVTTAAVRGAVTDEQGAAIAGAEVTITNVDTSFTRTTATGGDGEYNFPDLPLGLYKIRATHAGFKSSEQTGITLHANDRLVVNVGLKVGAISESVTVEASPITVETTNGELSGLIQGSQVADLPLNGRNFMQLVTSVPGVAAGPQFSALAKGLKGGSDLSISGGAVDANLWLVDGASNNDVGSNRTILVFPSVDAIEELKIERNSYGPEFGQSAGGQISMVTKSGSNGFHGDVYYFGRNDKLNAFDTFVKSGCLAAKTPCVKNKLRRNDYGYTIGGPIKKDKIFFFWSEEWNKMIEGQTTTQRVPTTAEKGGDFTAIAACPNAVSQLGFPASGMQVPLNKSAALGGTPAYATTNPAIVPTAQLSPAAQVVLQAYPTPTDPNPCARNNFTKSFGVPTNWREENIRGDINLTKTLRAMMRFTSDSWVLGPPDGGFGWGNNNLGPIGQFWSQPGRVVVGRLSKTIGTSMVNDFTFSYSANRITITPAGDIPGLDQKLNDTIPTFFPLSGKTYGDKGPAVWINCCGLPSVWTIAPWQNQEDMYTWQDDLSWVKGRHTFKFGALYSRNYKAEQAANGEFGTLGGAVGYNGYTDPNSKTSTLYGIADLELLNMGMGWSETQDIFKVRNVWHNIEAYAADNFRLTPRLTLSYGIRWSFLPPVYLSDNKYTLFNPSAYNAALGNTPCNGLVYAPGLGANPCPAGTGGVAGPNNALMNRNFHGFAPRLSLAWDPTGHGKWAIRTGVGQFFNRDRLWPLQLAGSNPPFNASFVGAGANGGHNARFLDNTNALPVCGTGACFSTGLGTPNTGQEFSNNVPNSWQWNLTVQHELFKDARLEVGYVGSKTLHWEAVTDINAVPPADRLTYVQNLLDSTRSAAVSSGLRPFGASVGDNGIKYYTHASSASYHSLQSMFNARMGNNANFQASYTFSKLLSDSQRIDTPAFNVDAYNLKADWGPDILNHPHIFSANVVYHLPALTDKSTLERTALGGWEVTPIVSIASGPSITTFMSLGGTGAVGDPMGVGGGGATGRERANRVAGQSCRAHTGDATQWLNPALYTMNGYQLGKIGNAGAGLCSGPGNNNYDLGLDKNFKLTERIKMQFRLEFFNLFNHPHYNSNDILNPTVNFQNPIYGNAAGAAVPNVSTATQILSATPSPGSYGKVNSIVENGYRQIQYALKFTF
jgi:Carboxypeptidase regulatory-like domain